jgi:hypothetical protein
MTVLEHAQRVALMGVAGPRPAIGPVAGLPLLHVDHAELTGVKRVIKSFFDDPRVTTAGPWLRPRHVANWSPALEVQILGKTCAAVVKGREAY